MCGDIGGSMTYKESYLKCNSLEEMRKEVVKDLAHAKLTNPDRIKYITEAAEQAANEKFNTADEEQTP